MSIPNITRIFEIIAAMIGGIMWCCMMVWMAGFKKKKRRDNLSVTRTDVKFDRIDKDIDALEEAVKCLAIKEEKQMCHTSSSDMGPTVNMSDYMPQAAQTPTPAPLVSRTCPNCGAPVRGYKCEYCGSEFERKHGANDLMLTMSTSFVPLASACAIADFNFDAFDRNRSDIMFP